MYTYKKPIPFVVDLAGKEGFAFREQVAAHLHAHLNVTGAQRGSVKEQSYGKLAEAAIRKGLGLEPFPGDDEPISFDLSLPSGVRVDVKCRGGEKAFQVEYLGGDGLPREAKHNLFARQIYAENLDTDIYVLTHLQHPDDAELPGTRLQKKWKLFVCGWVSKARVLREGVYLPPGALSERGRSWFDYRSHEIEFYNHNLNGLSDIQDLTTITSTEVAADASNTGRPNLTSVDAVRICYDLIGRGVLNVGHLDALTEKLGIDRAIKPILHGNQYHHLVEWMIETGIADDAALKTLKEKMAKEEFTGL